MESTMGLKNSSLGPNPGLSINMMGSQYAMGSDAQDAIIGQIRRLEASLRAAKQKEEKMLGDLDKMSKKIRQYKQ